MRRRVAEAALKKIDEEITDFQKEKQSKLNDIDMVITLKMHQMEYLVDGRLPDDISQGLVFSNASLRRLKVPRAIQFARAAPPESRRRSRSSEREPGPLAYPVEARAALDRLPVFPDSRAARSQRPGDPARAR